MGLLKDTGIDVLSEIYLYLLSCVIYQWMKDWMTGWLNGVKTKSILTHKFQTFRNLLVSCVMYLSSMIDWLNGGKMKSALANDILFQNGRWWKLMETDTGYKIQDTGIDLGMFEEQK